jgi:hypothetical protein
MKKLVLTLGLVLTSPLLLAQNSTDDDKKKQSATPAIPATPATPASSAVGEPKVEGPTTTDEGQTSGSARSGKQSAGATGNPDTKSGKTRTRNEFGSLDSNGDNKISQDELKVYVELGARFGEADLNKDGNLSRGEFSKLETSKVTGGSSGNTGRTSSGSDSEKQETTEGSDRTDKDDELNRKLPGQ